jgi:thermopsin
VSYNLRLVALVAVSIAAIMVLSAGAVNSPSRAVISPSALAPATVASSAAPAHVATAAASAQAKVLAALQSTHTPMKDVFLPNFSPRVSIAGGHVTPLYNISPDPTGLGDFGIKDVGGHDVGSVSYTSSIEGAITLNQVDPLYVTSSAPDEFTIQLNTVLTNVDVLGDTNYDYWIQNVPIYAAGSQTLSFEDNIWNFSSPTTFMGYNAIYSGHGSIVGGGEVYIAGGPSYHVPTPFTVVTYNNATVLNDRPTEFFNYSIISGSVHISGSYDQVEFNSVAGTPTTPAPEPVFQINGLTTNPTNFLLNDAEIMIGGPGGGSTTTMFNIAGSAGLWLLPNGTTTYQAVPSAYDFGTDTGETSEGIAEATTGGSSPVATLSSGPALPYPLWGLVGAHAGVEKITIHLNPTNAFVFASIGGGGFNENFAAWGPTAVSGPTVYWLSPQDYTFEFLLSDHTPITVGVPLSGGHNLGVTLKYNPSMGDYTPLWAEANSQLKAISYPGGAGTISNPYVLFNTPATVSPLFGELNDYAFQVFPGLYLIDTTAYVSFVDAPLFAITYLPIQNEGARLALNGAPGTNDLNFELYDASHVSIVASPAISGWSYTAGGFGEPGSIYLWNSSYDLIAGNTFWVQSNGITTSGGGFNTIWGNVFYPASTSAADPSATVLNAGSQVGLWEFESNDLIYDNAFLTPLTATLFPENFYTGAFEPFTDRWNVSLQPASDVRMVNGWALSGDILGLSTQGGNYWNNYGSPEDPYMVLPYNNGGYIWAGGDYHPLTYTLEQVRFHEAGLPSGTAWSVTLNGYTQSTTGTSITFWEINGAYPYSVGPVSGFTAHPASGTETVSGHWDFTWINFT